MRPADPHAGIFQRVLEALYKNRCQDFMEKYRARQKKYDAKNGWWYYGPVYYDKKLWGL